MFTFPTAGRPAALSTAHAPAPAPTPPVATIESDSDDIPLDLTETDIADDELMLDSEDILADPVVGSPIAPPADEDDGTVIATGEAKPRESGTLFERMSNIARGAQQAQVEDEPAPGFRREPLDIPRFLNRQNNQ